MYLMNSGRSRQLSFEESLSPNWSLPKAVAAAWEEGNKVTGRLKGNLPEAASSALVWTKKLQQLL